MQYWEESADKQLEPRGWNATGPSSGSHRWVSAVSSEPASSHHIQLRFALRFPLACTSAYARAGRMLLLLQLMTIAAIWPCEFLQPGQSSFLGRESWAFRSGRSEPVVIQLSWWTPPLPWGLQEDENFRAPDFYWHSADVYCLNEL